MPAAPDLAIIVKVLSSSFPSHCATPFLLPPLAVVLHQFCYPHSELCYTFLRPPLAVVVQAWGPRVTEPQLARLFYSYTNSLSKSIPYSWYWKDFWGTVF